MVSRRKCDIIVYSIGGFLFVFGIALGIAWPYILDAVLTSLLSLWKGSVMYGVWSDPPIPAYLELYMFNWTNAKEFKDNQTIKPELDEIGPFVFKEVHKRIDVEFNDNYTMTYNQSRTWYYVPEESLDLSTEITHLNVLPAVLSYLSRFWNLELYYAIFDALLDKHEDLYITAKAEDWLFNGIDDAVLEWINILKRVADIDMPFERFGWFYGRNGTSEKDGIYVMKTGTDDIYNLGFLEKWNHMTEVPYFTGKCNNIQGLAGEVMPPMDGINDNLTMFAPDICSLATLNYAGHGSVEGIDGLTYTGDHIFDDGTLVPDNECFCTGECIPSGARNISPCFFRAPAFVSLPHFYQGDQSYLDAVIGLKPDKDKHTFKFTLHPDLGLPMEVSAMLQLNILLQKNEWYGMYRDSPKIFMPMLWFKQRAKLDGDWVYLVKLLNSAPAIGMGIFYGLAGIGFLMLFSRFIITLRHNNRKFKRSEVDT